MLLLPLLRVCIVGVLCRWQHQTSESLTKAISCPSVDAAAAAAAAVIGSCAPSQQDGAAATSPLPAVTAPSLASQEPASSLLGSQPPAGAEGPVLTALLSMLKWADSVCAVAAPGSGGHYKRGSSGSGGAGGGSGEGQAGTPALSFSVVLDERQHGTQSLLHSGLSRLQGEVLCAAVSQAGTRGSMLWSALPVLCVASWSQ